jgi:hypothetical protein
MPVCQRIRDEEAEIYVIGIKNKTSIKLRKEYKFFDIEKDIVKKPAKPTKKSPSAPRTATIRKKLTQAYQETPLKDGWAYKKQFEKAMLHLDKSFVTRWSKKQIWTWFSDLKEFIVEVDRVQMKSG